MRRASWFAPTFSLIVCLAVLATAPRAFGDDTPATDSGVTAQDAGGSREPASTRRHVLNAADNKTDNPAMDATPSSLNDTDRSVLCPPSGSATAYGVQFQAYYDPLSIIERLNLGAFTGQYGYQNSNGVGGLQAMFVSINRHHFEIATGFDYVFPVNVQGQQSFTGGNYFLNSQTFSMMGVKPIQVGYRVAAGPMFTIVPYGGVGLYYGTNTVTMAQSAPSGPTDTVTYAKLIGTIYAGGRLDFDFNQSRTFAAGIAAEFFVPFKVAGYVSQSGPAEQTGIEPALQSNMEFFNNVGGRVVGTLAAYF